MHWADRIAQNIIDTHQHEPYWVDDMKTPSGRIHVGSLRGVLIHDIVAKALRDHGVEANYTYVFNDMDPMDGLPNYLDPVIYEPYMGVPVYKIPSPDGVSKNFAVQYANDFIEIFTKLGASPNIVWSHQLYESGKMNQVIKDALDQADKIRDIYLRVAKQQRPDNWYPFQVICPQCGKLGTTKVNLWNGESVHFTCEPEMVKWARGCGYEGEVSPFNGTGKLMWKVDWPAHWKVIGITIEGAGKDHSSEGGSRDIAQEIVKDVYNYPEPFDIPYEWFLIGGRKMSSSKGVGTSAREFAELLPPTIGRFLFVKTKFSRQMNFDPTGMTIPDLFDDYDKMAEEYWGGLKSDYARIFELSQIDAVPARHFLPRFRLITQIIQNPKINIVDEFTKLKGEKLSDQELTVLIERIYYAQIWVDRYAPKDLVFKVTQKQEIELSNQQQQYLKSIIPLIEKVSNPEELQQELYQTAKAQSISPKDAFGAIYLLLIGKTHGPKAAWLVLENKDTLRQKIDQLESMTIEIPDQDIVSSNSSRISLGASFKQKYPSASIGYALIEGVTVRPTDESIGNERQQLLEELQSLTTEQINQFPEILSYRRMYKSMGIDWHSRRPSPEALLRRIATGKGLYEPINNCVDAYNLVVMKRKISIGAFDADKISFPVEVKLAEGGETAFFIGDTNDPTILKTGEVCYFDHLGPYNLDYNYRDIIRTAVTLETKNLWINTEGIFDISPLQVRDTLELVIATIQKHCGGALVEKGIIKAS